MNVRITRVKMEEIVLIVLTATRVNVPMDLQETAVKQVFWRCLFLFFNHLS